MKASHQYKILFFVSVVVGLFTHCYHLTLTEHPSGWDGYYYVMQLHSWWEHGQMQSPDSSLIYPFLSVFRVFSDDYVVVVKLGVVVLVVLFIVSCVLIGGVGRQEKQWSWLLVFLLVMSPSLTFVAAQYPKNLLGFIFLIWCLRHLTERRFLLAVLFFLLTFFTHRMTAGLAVLFVPIILYQYSHKLFFWATSVMILTTLAVTIFLPGLLHWTDLSRFQGEFSMEPGFAPLTFPDLWNWKLSFWWFLEIALHFILVLALLIRLVRSKQLLSFHKFTVLLFWIQVVLLFPFFNMEAGSVGYRFYLISLLLTPLLAMAVLRERNIRLPVILSILLILCAVFSYRAYDISLFNPDYNLYSKVADNVIKHMDVLYTQLESEEKPDLIVAHQGIAELIIIKSDIDALNWSPSSSKDPRLVWRVVAGLRKYDFVSHLDERDMERIVRLDVNYYLVPEIIWNKMKISVRKAKDNELLSRMSDWRNPSEERPQFLSRFKDKIKDY